MVKILLARFVWSGVNDGANADPRTGLARCARLASTSVFDLVEKATYEI
jgi:hypothetical protein